MTNTANVKFSEQNLTDQVSTPVDGINFLSGITLRGPFNKPDEIFNSWESWKKEFGGFVNDDSPLKLQRLFEKNGRVRFSRLGHYTAIATRSTLTAVKAAADDPIVDADDNELFELVLKNEGVDYNNVSALISAPSNNVTGYFNLQIVHTLEPELNETYANLSITELTTAGMSNFLSDVVNGSRLMNVVYKDLSTFELTNGFLTPVIPTIITFSGGTDGGALVAADYIGDSASNTGFHAFDDWSDAYQIGVATSAVADAVHVAGAAYAANSKDLMYWGFLDNSLNNKAAIIAKIQALSIDSKYTAFFGGGLYVTDPMTSQKKEIEALTDIMALANNSDMNFGVHYSFAGKKRGVITNTQGVVNNFGSPAKAGDLNELANNRMNMIINRDGTTFLKDQFTQQVKFNQESYINVVRGVISIKKNLRVVLDDYLQDPNDMTTWKLMYYQAKVYLDNLVTKRALFSYQWLGDQFAKSLAELQVNSPANVTAGKYRIKLLLSFIPSMQEIEVVLVLTPGNISFELANQLVA